MKRTYTKLLQLTCFLCILFAHESWSQIKLGENPKTISPYALLELESTSKGLIIPRMMSTQRDSTFDQNTPVGTLIYNTDYQMLSLSELETFMKTNKHLPGVQSSSEIEEKGHWNVTENVRTNLEKVEELFLYTLEQEKKIEAQEARLQAQ